MANCSETCEAEQTRTLPIDFFYSSAGINVAEEQIILALCLSISCGRLANEVKLSARRIAPERC